MSEVQEDDGITLAADGGAFVRTTVRVSRDGDRLTVAATVSGSGFDEFARTEHATGAPRCPTRAAAWLDGEAVEMDPGPAGPTIEVPHTHDFTWEAVLA